MKSALNISFAGIGDTLFATPFIHELRENFPGARIDAFVRWRGSKDVLEGNPHLNSVFQMDLVKASPISSLRFLWSLRRSRYDVSFNTHPQSRVHYRLVSRMVNAPRRVSHSYEGFNALDRFLVNDLLPQDYQRHSVENNLDLLRFVGGAPRLRNHGYELYPGPGDLQWAADFVQKHALGAKRLLGIHVGSGGTKNLALRRWPLKSFIELLRRLNHARPELAVLLFGGPEEQKDHAALMEAVKSPLVFHPQTRSLRQAAALVQKCEAFLSVDTSLMHIAAAMKVPHQIVIETPTWNKPIQPYGNAFTLVPNPAVAGRNLEFYRYDGSGIRGSAEELRRCMASVTIERVFEVVSDALPKK